MQTKQSLAAALFDSGFNCAQSVLAVFCEDYGLDRETALIMACGLGGGFRSGEICGAASGAVLVIGLKYGQCRTDDASSKLNCYAKTAEFLNAFRAKNKSCVCRELLGCDISTPKGHAEAQSKNLFQTRCVGLVKSAVETLEELGY